MNTETGYQLTSPLGDYVDALRSAQPSEAALQGAQDRLLKRLAERSPRSVRRSLGVWAFAASACLVVGISLVPLLSPSGGRAFAQVQQHFLSFQSLSMAMEQQVMGNVVLRSTVLVSAEGRVRVDIGDQLSVLVDPAQGRGLNLLHGPKQAVSFEFEAGALPQSAAGLEWLQELRDFQGQAVALPEPRMIRGEQAWGWALQIDGMNTELWARSDGLPLAMEVESGDMLQLDFSFEFDLPIDPTRLSLEVPAGYQQQRDIED